jgi:hypothetical protein
VASSTRSARNSPPSLTIWIGAHEPRRDELVTAKHHVVPLPHHHMGRVGVESGTERLAT